MATIRAYVYKDSSFSASGSAERGWDHQTQNDGYLGRVSWFASTQLT
jgi:hypothetical protein